MTNENKNLDITELLQPVAVLARQAGDKILKIYEGTKEMEKIIISRALLGK